MLLLPKSFSNLPLRFFISSAANTQITIKNKKIKKMITPRTMRRVVIDDPLESLSTPSVVVGSAVVVTSASLSAVVVGSTSLSAVVVGSVSLSAVVVGSASLPAVVVTSVGVISGVVVGLTVARAVVSRSVGVSDSIVSRTTALVVTAIIIDIGPS